MSADKHILEMSRKLQAASSKSGVATERLTTKDFESIMLNKSRGYKEHKAGTKITMTKFWNYVVSFENSFVPVVTCIHTH